MRIAFVSCHGYLDPSSGAARSTRNLLELLAARGADCRVLTTGILDFRDETSLHPILSRTGVSVRRVRAALTAGASVPAFDLAFNRVRITLMPTASSRIERSPDRREAAALLDLADQVFTRFRPQRLLAYGGHPASRELMARARRRGIPVVFLLQNFAYARAGTFAHADAVVVPSEFARRPTPGKVMTPLARGGILGGVRPRPDCFRRKGE